jgi:hypothetical protein
MHDFVEGKRNRFFRGKRMRAEEFIVEQDYAIARRRLINRAVLGWGIIEGFALSQPKKPSVEEPGDGRDAVQEAQAPDAPKADEHDRDIAGEEAGAETLSTLLAEPAEKVEDERVEVSEPTPAAAVLEVGPGFAFDKHGREIVHTGGKDELTAKNTFLMIKAKNAWRTRPVTEVKEHGKYILAVHYAECRTGGTFPSADDCGCEPPERSYVRETAVFSLRREDECPCGDERCDDYDETACRTDACGPDVRGPHAQLAEWIANRRDVPESALYCWGDLNVALCEPVDLACLLVDPVKDDCTPLSGVITDRTGPRHLVKNNELLFDLLRGCDLTRIADISWKAWHRRRRDNPVEWAEFLEFFDLDDEIDHGDPASGRYSTFSTNFVVTFSGWVNRASIDTDVVAMRMIPIPPRGSGGWASPRSIPIGFVDTTPSDGTHGKFTDRLRIEVRRSWANLELKGPLSKFRGHTFYIEIEVRGDLIEDCRGLPIDADARGLTAVPTGNGAPGGTFISRFAVERMPGDPTDTD